MMQTEIQVQAMRERIAKLEAPKWLIPLAGCLLVCALPLALLTLGLLVWKATALPVYSMEQVPSAHTGYRRTMLTNGNTVYVLDYEEYALLSINTEPPDKIGELPVSEGSVSGV